MSEAEQLLPFNELDITMHAFTNSEHGPATAIMAATEVLTYVDPDFFGQDLLHFENEQRFVAMRREWLIQADECFRQKDYTACIQLLKLIIEDIQHAGYFNDSHVALVEDIKEQCYTLSARSRGKAILEQTTIPLAS